MTVTADFVLELESVENTECDGHTVTRFTYVAPDGVMLSFHAHPLLPTWLVRSKGIGTVLIVRALVEFVRLVSSSDCLTLLKAVTYLRLEADGRPHQNQIRLEDLPSNVELFKLDAIQTINRLRI